MFGEFENFIRMFSEEFPEEQKPCDSVKEICSCKYYDDIVALKQVYGELNGKTIHIELQELLGIAPRERRRIEAYVGLRHWLQKNFGCILCITSRKSK